MKIKNLTTAAKEIQMVEIVSGQAYPISIQGSGLLEIPSDFMVDLDKLDPAVFEIIGEKAIVKEVVITPIKEEDTLVKEEIVPMNENKFICEVCKAEFASARGLNSHMSRAHSDSK